MRRPENAPFKAARRILIVDPQPVIREGLTRILRDDPELEVVASAGTPAEALKLITTTALDGVILELVHAEGGGLDLVRSVRAANPDLAILVYSMGDGALYAARVIRAGASGFVSKTDDVKALVHALKKTLAGAVHVDEATAGRLLQAGGGSPLDRLTDRELEVLQLIGRGLRSRDIAESLKLSEKTIEGYRAQLRAKLGLADAAQLLQSAIKWVRLSAV